MTPTLEVLHDGAASLNQRLPAKVRPWTPARLMPGGCPAEASFRVECLLSGDPESRLSAQARFLHPLLRTEGGAATGYEASEREVIFEDTRLEDLDAGLSLPFAFPPALEIDGDTARFQCAIEGEIELAAERVGPRLYRIAARVENLTASDSAGREMRAISAVHLVLHATGGEFLSLANPPKEFRSAATSCANPSGRPVLVGDPNKRDTVLAAGAGLSDYPRVNPQSWRETFAAAGRVEAPPEREKQDKHPGDPGSSDALRRIEQLPPSALRGLRELLLARRTSPQR